MTLTIVDTTVLVDALRGRHPAIRFLEQAAEDGVLWSSVLVRAELFLGSREGEESRISGLLAGIAWRDVTPVIADQAGRLGAPYRGSHRLGIVDLVIAATTIDLGGTLATLNIRDFPMFPGLQPAY